jgi:hypothetical protein
MLTARGLWTEKCRAIHAGEELKPSVLYSCGRVLLLLPRICLIVSNFDRCRQQYQDQHSRLATSAKPTRHPNVALAGPCTRPFRTGAFTLQATVKEECSRLDRPAPGPTKRQRGVFRLGSMANTAVPHPLLWPYGEVMIMPRVSCRILRLGVHHFPGSLKHHIHVHRVMSKRVN